MKVQLTALVDVGYWLVLNPMFGKAEGQQEFGPFGTKEAALAFHDSERVEPYTDEGPDHYSAGSKGYRKTFRKGGPLEWCNPLYDGERDKPGTFGHGVHESTKLIQELSRVPA